MKKIKNLSALTIYSFVTSADYSRSQTFAAGIKGGALSTVATSPCEHCQGDTTDGGPSIKDQALPKPVPTNGGRSMCPAGN